MQVQGRACMGGSCTGRQGETSMFILKFYFIFCNCLINRQGPNLSTANQPVYMQDMESLYISGHFARAIAFSLAHCQVQPLCRRATVSRPRVGGCCHVLKSRWPHNGHPAVVAATSAQLPCVGGRKLLRFVRAPSSFCWSQVEELSVLNEHAVVTIKPQNRSTPTPIKS